MADWVALAAALNVEIREEDRSSVIAPLEKLERDFRPLQEKLPFDAPLWTE
jgi:hypothetical protein